MVSRKRTTVKSSFFLLETVVAMLLLFVATGLFMKLGDFYVSFERYNTLQEIENNYYKNYKTQWIYDKNDIKLVKRQIL